MNTIKYRALAKDGTWRYGYYPYLNVDMGNTRYPLDIFWNNFLHSFRRETLGQWTGLSDKLGKEIYEGDIIRQRSYPGYAINVIDYESESDGSYANWNFSYDLDEFGERPNKEWEVIGNIYENPELLKEIE